jgi:hypothetical protein
MVIGIAKPFASRVPLIRFVLPRKILLATLVITQAQTVVVMLDVHGLAPYTAIRLDSNVKPVTSDVRIIIRKYVVHVLRIQRQLRSVLNKGRLNGIAAAVL